ncbi:glutamate 5-kinase [Dasania sp. GY-MA-18]|uniref:Glutamate 5-kinase n=1 Tax=Dasania phycosphaerae TaxID=2950436 RepID=A0A9J6RQD4_9GAMM|nr:MULTISPECIES: glutamate 5-kinase [Dasania]MCR8924135.1 glutamate 5-kinase [Dasania sp. GY-MA-18]MCZ0866708.1 glutamate 5-kinase [Dasania phycosphaerae]MCZ0870293.1 glutamate 5-kinase [Dasania phycosphaerae]
MDKPSLSKTQRWVVKIGSALLTAGGKGLDVEAIANWTAQMAELRQRGIELVLVSSGAVAEGMTRLGWSQRPSSLHDLQAAAAVGQMGLVQAYESCFKQYDIHTAQILLGHDDISARDRYLNARGTIARLLELGVVPVVNENDTVVTDEIRFGDNDTLGALVANLIDADLLVILTDQQGLFASDPRANPDAELISFAHANDASLDAMASGGSGALGRGGMLTKVRAARLAARSGTHTVIAGGALKNVLVDLVSDKVQGTLLVAEQAPLAARKQWLAGQSQMCGSLQLDDGAVAMLRSSGKSLLPVGVAAISGNFDRGDFVVCVDAKGVAVARGIVNYSAAEAQKIIGKGSAAMQGALGYQGDVELIHRDNLVLV